MGLKRLPEVLPPEFIRCCEDNKLDQLTQQPLNVRSEGPHFPMGLKRLPEVLPPEYIRCCEENKLDQLTQQPLNVRSEGIKPPNPRFPKELRRLPEVLLPEFKRYCEEITLDQLIKAGERLQLGKVLKGKIVDVLEYVRKLDTHKRPVNALRNIYAKEAGAFVMAIFYDSVLKTDKIEPKFIKWVQTERDSLSRYCGRGPTL